MRDEIGKYQALARKYRPQKFSEIIGQETLVTTLSNGLKWGRMHHAFMLTGVRGTGKTTTARIIARAVNCTGRELAKDPNPCGICEACCAITAEMSLDVIEMDAASHTGVNDIRSLIESVKYRPTSGNFKIYIIDEVHMLSKSAFNALLKTLEEPPDYVKFIFATTELSKVPATILSRCQHFELNRLTRKDLANYFAEIAQREAIKTDAEAMMQIAESADGSVRDGQSLLDQAITLAGESKIINYALISQMLRLNDQNQIYQLLDAVFRGDYAQAQTLLAEFYQQGAEPEIIIRDLLNAVYWLTRLKLTPNLVEDLSLSEVLRFVAAQMAKKLDLPRLTRAWQILQQGASELTTSPVKLQSVEMLIVKLCYAANLPDPASLMHLLDDAIPSAESSPPPTARIQENQDAKDTAKIPPETKAQSFPNIAPLPIIEPLSEETFPQPTGKNSAIIDFQNLVTMTEQNHEAQLAFILTEQIICLNFTPYQVTFYPLRELSVDFTEKLQKFIMQQTGEDWEIIWQETNPDHLLSLQQLALAKKQAEEQALKQTDFMKKALHLFPDAQIIAIDAIDNAIDNQENL